jgi:hypothetical protein
LTLISNRGIKDNSLFGSLDNLIFNIYFKEKAMTKGIFRIALMAALMSAFAASIVYAADANAPVENKPIPIVSKMNGTVSAVKDANGVVLAVKLTTADKVSHNLLLDDESMDLARKMDGKEVTVHIMKKENGELKVVSFKTAEKAAQKQSPKPAPKPKANPGSKK